LPLQNLYFPLSFSRRKIKRVKERLRLSYIIDSPSREGGV